MIKQKGFTLMELVVVVVIMGIVVGVAVPSYESAIYNATAKEAVSNLRSMYAGFQVYKMKNGAAPLGTTDVSLIDSRLNLELEEVDFDYILGANPTFYIGQAKYPRVGAAKYILRIKENFNDSNNSGIVWCSSGTCPSF